MFKLLGKLPWFEWVGILSVLAALGVGLAFVKNYGRMEESNKTLNAQTQDLSHLLLVEKKAAVITDNAVFKYTYERDLKIEEALGYQAQTLEEYFATRDNNDPTKYEKPEEGKPDAHIAPRKPQPAKATQPKPVVVASTDPDPAAIAVLVSGMWHTYCRAYNDKDACPAQGNADGVHAQ
jgi:hypothetical protein